MSWDQMDLASGSSWLMWWPPSWIALTDTDHQFAIIINTNDNIDNNNIHLVYMPYIGDHKHIMQSAMKRLSWKLKRWVVRWCLNVCSVVVDWISAGNRFQVVGQEYKNICSLSLARRSRLRKSPLPVEWRPECNGLAEVSSRTSARCDEQLPAQYIRVQSLI